MRIISWNVNGLRALLSKDKEGKRGTDKEGVLFALIDEQKPDVLALQETRCSGDIDPKLPDDFVYKRILASKTKKGYSGVGIFSKVEVITTIVDFIENDEGRVLCVEYPDFFLVNAYVCNTKPDLSRLEYRIHVWEKSMREFLNKLQKKKPVIYTGDLNVAPTELDIHTVQGHERSHGFTIEERNAFTSLLKECNLVDTYRLLHPNTRKYSWFSNLGRARENNKGWRIDFCLVSKALIGKVKKSDILEEYMGSDHKCTLLDIDI